MKRQTTSLALGGLSVAVAVTCISAAPAWAEEGPPDGIGAITDEAIEFEIEREVHYGENPPQPPSGAPDQGSGSGSSSGEEQVNEDDSGGSNHPEFRPEDLYAPPPGLRMCTDDGAVVGSECLEVMQEICEGEDSAITARSCPGDAPPPAPEQPAAEPRPGEPVEEDEPEPLPVVTETDFAELPIEASSVGFEPELQGFGFLDSHTNVFAESETQVLTEEMLGYQVDIRAIPIEYHFDYGDGSTTSSFESGSALPDYDSAGYAVDKTDTPTATSHVYTATGTYGVSIATDYIGEYRVDGGEWIGIPGEATISSSPGSADIWRMSSRSVGGECESQDAWGCNGPVELEPGDEPPAIFEDQYDETGNWTG